MCDVIVVGIIVADEEEENRIERDFDDLEVSVIRGNSIVNMQSNKSNKSKKKKENIEKMRIYNNNKSKHTSNEIRN